MKELEQIISLIVVAVAGWYFGYNHCDLIEPILHKWHNKRLKKKRKKLQDKYSWTYTWEPYRTQITIECAVNDSVDENERDRLIKHLREKWEDGGIRVVVKDFEEGEDKND